GRGLDANPDRRAGRRPAAPGGRGHQRPAGGRPAPRRAGRGAGWGANRGWPDRRGNDAAAGAGSASHAPGATGAPGGGLGSLASGAVLRRDRSNRRRRGDRRSTV
ncbi:MAG: hypothetical protein AVDCRST_MAG73-1742, partial [uncultured Thermomicrobiales bacterium]